MELEVSKWRRRSLERDTRIKIWAVKNYNNIRHKNQESLWWRDIKKAINEEVWGNWFENNIMWKVGKESKTMFWDDKWISERPPRIIYPRLYANSLNKNGMVSKFGRRNNQEWVWEIKWKRCWFE